MEGKIFREEEVKALESKCPETVISGHLEKPKN